MRTLLIYFVLLQITLPLVTLRTRERDTPKPMLDPPTSLVASEHPDVDPRVTDCSRIQRALHVMDARHAQMLLTRDQREMLHRALTALPFEGPLTRTRFATLTPLLSSLTPRMRRLACGACPSLDSAPGNH